jgi:hypothetical protein
VQDSVFCTVQFAVTCSSRTHTECIVAFPLQQRLRERTIVLSYTYIACLVKLIEYCLYISFLQTLRPIKIASVKRNRIICS